MRDVDERDDDQSTDERGERAPGHRAELRDGTFGALHGELLHFAPHARDAPCGDAAEHEAFGDRFDELRDAVR